MQLIFFLLLKTNLESIQTNSIEFVKNIVNSNGVSLIKSNNETKTIIIKEKIENKKVNSLKINLLVCFRILEHE